MDWMDGERGWGVLMSYEATQLSPRFQVLLMQYEATQLSHQKGGSKRTPIS